MKKHPTLLTHALCHFLLAASLAILVSCGDADQGETTSQLAQTPTPEAPVEPEVTEPAEDPDLDTDEDNLSDVEERKWGTDPNDPDTDGDGFNDGYEVYDLQFERNWEDRPHKFNPLIADLPKIDIDLRSPPHLTMDFTTTEDETKSFSASRTKATSQSVTTTNTFEESLSVEDSVGVGPDGIGVSVSVSASETFGWSQAQSKENSRSVTRAEEFARSNSITKSGGSLAVTVDVSNPGDIAYTIRSLTLNALLLDPRRLEVLIPVGNLTYGKWGELSDVTLQTQGRQKIEGLVFSKSDLNLDMVKQILRDQGNLVVRISAFELDGEDGPLNLRFTEIGAKTAEIGIDYGGTRPPESFLVSTYSEEGRGLPLTKVLNNILRIKQQSGEFEWEIRSSGDALVMFGGMAKLTGLQDVRDFKTDSKRRARWAVIHTTASRGETVKKRYDPLVKSYQAEDVMVKAGDSLKLVYIEDVDGDGLGARAEFVHRTDPNKADTDKDGLSDKVEVDGWKIDLKGESILVRTNPTAPDTDGDGTLDGVEKKAGTDAAQPLLDLVDVKLTGTKERDSVSQVVVDDEGNVFICGEMDRESSNPLFVAKYNAHGDQVWLRRFVHVSGGHDTCQVSGMAIGKDGRIYIAISEYVKGRAYEHFVKHGGRKQPPLEHRNRLVLRVMSPQGQRLSDTIVATPQTEMPRDVVMDPEGNVYVSGTTSGTLTDGRRSKERDPAQAFIVKFDPQGKIVWAAQSDPKACRDMTISQGKYLILAGSEYFRNPETQQSNIRIKIRCLSLNANELWTTTLDTFGGESFADVGTDAAGNIFVAGSTDGTFDGEKAMGNRDGFVGKISPEGKVEWVRQIGTAANDSFISLAVARDGRIHLVGQTDTGDFDQRNRIGLTKKQDLFRAIVGLTGVEVDLQQIRTDFYERPSSIAIDAQGAVFITGTTDGTFGRFPMENKGGGDIFLMKFAPRPRVY